MPLPCETVSETTLSYLWFSFIGKCTYKVCGRVVFVRFDVWFFVFVWLTMLLSFGLCWVFFVCVLISSGLLCEHGSVKAHSKWAKKRLLQFSAGLFVEILVCVCG